MSLQQFPAKVLKRLGQLHRLGVRGMARTAYVRALGPLVYFLTDPARNMVAGLHRRRAITYAIPSRLQHLKRRIPTGISPAHPFIALEFGTDTGRFVQTLEAMLDLAAAGCSVPSVLGVDWTSQTIACEAVEGIGFGEWHRGTTIDEQVLTRMSDGLRAIHRSGYVVGEIDENDLIISKSRGPIISNLRNAIPLANLSRDMSVQLRDLDRRLFNELFGTRLLTAAKLKSVLSPTAAITRDRVRGLFSEVYAPVIIRDDIRWGKIWNTDLGTGRWNFIMKGNLPIPIGGSVLDLGSNNGFNPLQMLRAGAASAVGVEINELAIEQAMFLKSAYEWLDNRSYDFRCIHGSQADVAKFELPRFDVVTALCSLYYLPDTVIRELVRYIRTRTNVLVLQCNTDRLIDRAGQEEGYRKASVEYAIEVLEQGGFIQRRVIAPRGYSRPLVIGRSLEVAV